MTQGATRMYVRAGIEAEWLGDCLSERSSNATGAVAGIVAVGMPRGSVGSIGDAVSHPGAPWLRMLSSCATLTTAVRW